ncbi:MAG: hypothetical protein JSV51_09160 [Candidatus Bathyarchaeota archaeon]|nr:MAG: hypothetical protein JSV51_09160 [Candidatus Bathyarchaeota archaeon]
MHEYTQIYREVLLVRLIRNLTPDEIYRRICAFEDRYGLVFSDFEDEFFRKERPKPQVSDYLEWASLVDAYRGYEEGGELDYTIEEFQEFSSKKLAYLTPKRLELLNHLANTRVESINELAAKVKRNIKNVYGDLQVLKALGLLVLKRREKRNVVPETMVKEITFLVR